MKQKPYSTWKIVKRFGYTYFVVSVFGNHVGGLIYCEGNSMLPTLKHGDLIFAERLSVAKQNLCRGDLVCSINPLIPKRLICKRLAFKELDVIHNDGYNASRIPIGHCYLLGDNSTKSTDSRIYGPVPLGLVQNRLVLRVWPLSRFGWVTDRSYWQNCKD